jgi:hypothetical protein
MSQTLRKLVLTAHVTCSVGWLGAVVAFLALALAGVFGDDVQRIRGAYIAMGIVGWYSIVPFAVAALATGGGLSLGTEWGLVRHYWVLIKLVMTSLATIVLLVHMGPIDRVAERAATSVLSSADLHSLRLQLVGDAVAALVMLLVATVLSIYKPRGLTSYGARLRATTP